MLYHLACVETAKLTTARKGARFLYLAYAWYLHKRHHRRPQTLAAASQYCLGQSLIPACPARGGEGSLASTLP